MSRTNITITCLVLLFAFAACSKPASNAGASSSAPTASPARITSESVVKVEARPVEIRAGELANGIVQLTIQSGYHVNANPPTFPYLKPTVLEISPAEGVSIAFVTYPSAITKTFAFADKPLAIYEGSTELKATLKADKSATLGQRSIPAKLRIQACDEQVCYPPGAVDLVIPVNVR